MRAAFGGLIEAVFMSGFIGACGRWVERTALCASPTRRTVPGLGRSRASPPASAKAKLLPSMGDFGVQVVRGQSVPGELARANRCPACGDAATGRALPG